MERALGHHVAQEADGDEREVGSELESRGAAEARRPGRDEVPRRAEQDPEPRRGRVLGDLGSRQRDGRQSGQEGRVLRDDLHGGGQPTEGLGLDS